MPKRNYSRIREQARIAASAEAAEREEKRRRVDFVPRLSDEEEARNRDEREELSAREEEIEARLRRADIGGEDFAIAETEKYRCVGRRIAFARMDRFSIFDSHFDLKIYDKSTGEPIQGQLDEELYHALFSLLTQVIARIRNVFLRAKEGDQFFIPSLTEEERQQTIYYATIVSRYLKSGIHSRRNFISTPSSIVASQILTALAG